MSEILLLGFLIGMAHALEADHLVAVSALANREKNSKKRMVLRGAAWGLGHTVTLFIICSAVLLLGFTLTKQLSAALEFAVGIMLVLLGLNVLRQMIKKRIHFHAHSHEEGKPHLHAHGHQNATVPHDQDTHDHRHTKGFPLKALCIGLVHGAAGSAGLLALTVAASQDPLIALSYIALFGLGSILGMAMLSLALLWPMGIAERRAKQLHRALYASVGAFAIYLGISTMVATSSLAFMGGS